MSAPKVTVLCKRASITVAQELRYPKAMAILSPPHPLAEVAGKVVVAMWLFLLLLARPRTLSPAM